MPTRRTRGGISGQTRELQVDRSREPNRPRLQSRDPLRHLVFELRPDEVRDLLDSEMPDIEEPANVPEELLENDSELTAEDEDDVDASEDNEFDTSDFWLPLSPAARFSLSPEATPFLDLSRVYSFSIGPAASGRHMSCVFEAPAWASMAPRNRADRMMLQYLRRPIAFLRSAADWLEQNCQAFLKDPTPVRFAAAQGNFSNAPIVLQDGFRERINATLPEFLRLEKDSFTRLMRNVWLLWPNQSMPMQELFSDQFRQAWVAVGALYGLEPGDWQVDKFVSFTEQQLRDLERKDFRKLSQEERFHFLYRCVDIKAESALKAVRAEKDRRASLANSVGMNSMEEQWRRS
ncbi:MAG: hypothetical protein HY646_06070 [Acidobacteria bacterium]|nr:hypothetical protein [Acidobacteriota bacterium]